MNFKNFLVFWVVGLVSIMSFAAPQKVQDILCQETGGDAHGSRLSIYVNLDEKISPTEGYKLYGLTGSVTLVFRADIAKALNVPRRIEKKNLTFSKQPAIYSHELSTAWGPQGVNDAVSVLSLVPRIKNNNFTGRWEAELFESTITSIGLSLKTDQFTGEPALLCKEIKAVRQMPYFADTTKDDLKRANLEGELFFRFESGEKYDLGKYLLSGTESKAIMQRRLMKAGFFLTNERIVESGNSTFAIVNRSTLSEPDETQYIYFTNIAGIDFGVFVIKAIRVDAIIFEMENADGTKELVELRKTVGTFLPF